MADAEQAMVARTRELFFSSTISDRKGPVRTMITDYSGIAPAAIRYDLFTLFTASAQFKRPRANME